VFDVARLRNSHQRCRRLSENTLNPRSQRGFQSRGAQGHILERPENDDPGRVTPALVFEMVACEGQTARLYDGDCVCSRKNNPVMSALGQRHRSDCASQHFLDDPHVYFMHVHGWKSGDLPSRLNRIGLIGRAAPHRDIKQWFCVTLDTEIGRSWT